MARLRAMRAEVRQGGEKAHQSAYHALWGEIHQREGG